jgi:hypothetical protein
VRRTSHFGGTEPNWITLAGGIDLSLTDIPVSQSPLCSSIANPDVTGTSCSLYANSPFSIQQSSNSVTLTWTAIGDAYFTSTPGTLTPYEAILTSQFAGTDGTISGLEGDFANGPLVFSYSGTFTTTETPPSPVPEPGTWGLLLTGLLAAGFFFGRKRIAGQMQ